MMRWGIKHVQQEPFYGSTKINRGYESWWYPEIGTRKDWRDAGSFEDINEAYRSMVRYKAGDLFYHYIEEINE